MHLNTMTCRHYVGVVFFFLNVTPDDTVRYKIKFIISFYPLRTEKKASLHSCVYCTRFNCQDHCMLSSCRHFADKQPAECLERN